MVTPADQPPSAMTTTRKITAFAIMLLVLSAVDLLTTEMSLRLGAVELNPLVSPIVGTPWMVLVKLGIPAAVVLAAPIAKTIVVARALKLAVIVYIAVAVFNVTQLLATVIVY